MWLTAPKGTPLFFVVLVKLNLWLTVPKGTPLFLVVVVVVVVAVLVKSN